MPRSEVRLLDARDVDAFLAFAAADPVTNVFVDHRARTTRLERRWLGGEVWGRFVSGEMVSALHVGANVVPVQAGPEDIEAFAGKALAARRTAATIVGPQAPVEHLWELIGAKWGRPREIRAGQPHLAIDRPPAIAPDPLVRRSLPHEVDLVYPSCVAMYTEEVGVSPERGGGSALYRARVLQLVNRGWQFVRMEGDQVVFKAEIACASPQAAQIQGVYVPPERRGQGLAAAGMAAVVEQVRAEVAPVVSLYVNDWNVPARTAYDKVGFTEVGRFTTIMF